MNLIADPWIPVIREDGTHDTIIPWQIAEAENPVIEINAPRPDFQGALYQFMIGLLQTCFAPEDEDVWEERWKKLPTTDELRTAFEKVKDAFELDNPDGPAFMQDYDDLMDGESKKIAALLIGTPGEKTIKDNLDLFVKRDQIDCLCSACTATAIFTLQTNAPSGGSGHRVSLRGGGPLTTLVMSESTEDALWKKLWLNVLSQEEIAGAESIESSVLPWLGTTRLSQKGAITTPSDVHILQMYWGMPRRIRLAGNEGNGKCDICGKQAASVYKSYRTKKHGINYGGPWVHPLTPYRFDPEKKTPPLSIKGQKGGLGYRHWLGLALEDTEGGNRAAAIVRFFNDERRTSLFNAHSTSLWCFGYDMDKMKARCWYDSYFPIFALNDRQKINLIDWAGELIRTAREAIKILRTQVKNAWFRRPGDAKGNMSSIDQQFWQTTEPDFYRLLDRLAKLPGETRMAPPEIYLSWFQTLEKTVFQIFEKATLDSTPEDLDLKRIISAQQTLRRKFYGNRFIKDLKAKAIHEEAA